ncbi:hypothetical protein PHLCEN_2v13549 [Hermanssonia centrifuga]|uniref:Uncharacterized protein n=1 Tax=Hermanssonia centrifuga TaxID=98765 RepID=A0A2R6NEA5_9APHY|nr:hypothetical protein PHLCEN_2v13549 [Hermanssonia centrifuga]
MSTIWTWLHGSSTGTSERAKLSNASDSEITPLRTRAEPISQIDPLHSRLHLQPVTPEKVMQWRYEQSFYKDHFVDGSDSTGVELVLEIHQGEPEDGKTDLICGYYYADWERRVVFWQDDIHIVDITKGQRPLASMSHLDLVTSETSTAPYDLETIKEFVEIVHKIPASDESSTNIGNEGYEEGAGRDMIAIADGMFLNYHGQYCARLNRDQSVHSGGPKEKRLSAFFCLVSPILFYTPDSYMKKLDMVWVDDTLNHYRWKEFITRVREEWERYNTPATVMLTTNVAFLAIQSIDTDHADNARSFAQIASYASTLLSLACYTIYHVLILRFPHAHNRSLVKVSTYLKRRELGWLGLESLALVFSLPTSLFMWSMIAFLVAMSYAVFVGTDVYTKTLVGILLGILLAVTFSVVGITWQGGGRIPARENQWVEFFSSLKTQLVKRPPTEKDSGAPMTFWTGRSSPVSGSTLPL